MMLERKETASWHPALQWFVVSTYHLWASTVCTFLCARVLFAQGEILLPVNSNWLVLYTSHACIILSECFSTDYPVVHVNIVFILNFIVPLVGWGTDQLTGFGEERGTKHQVINLIHSVRTVMRSKFTSWSPKHEHQYNEGPRDGQNLFAMKRCCYIEILFHIFYFYWGKENFLLYRGLHYKEVR